jgi:hypothetical protein
MKKVKLKNFKAYDRIKKQWFTWAGWERKDLKPLCDLEGLIKFQEIKQNYENR